MSKQRQTNRKAAASRPYRWRCRGARRSLCPKQGWSLFGSSLRSLSKFKQSETLVAAIVSQRSTNAPLITFNVCDVDVELGELFTCALHALVHRLQDLLRVLLHPPGRSTHNQIWWFRAGGLRGFMRDLLLTLPLGSSA